MMELATWIAVIVLGPGALAVFVWFLFDLRKIFRVNQPPPAHEKGRRD